MRSCLIVVGCLVAAAAGAPAIADMALIQGIVAGSTEQIGRFTGSMTYTSNTLNTGTLTIVLNNTNTPSQGGYITGAVFGIPGMDTGAAATLVSGTPAGFMNTGTESGSPFGTFDAGAALGGSWLGGGSPTGGIAAGGTGTLVFSVVASDASTLKAAEFAGAPGSEGLVVRFRGFANGESDKVPGQLVPAPGAAALLGVGGALLIRRRRR